MNYNKVHCIDEIFWRGSADTYWMKYTCNSLDCSRCEGNSCRSYGALVIATVSTVGDMPDDLPNNPNCKYGDTIDIRAGISKGDPDRWFRVTEFVVTQDQ